MTDTTPEFTPDETLDLNDRDSKNALRSWGLDVMHRGETLLDRIVLFGTTQTFGYTTLGTIVEGKLKWIDPSQASQYDTTSVTPCNMGGVHHWGGKPEEYSRDKIGY